MPIEEAKSDIETYLKTQLPELVSSPEFAELGQRAGGLFHYAATTVKYLTLLDSITVGEQTEMLNDLLSNHTSQFLQVMPHPWLMIYIGRLCAMPQLPPHSSRTVMMKPQGQFCTISMLYFIPKMIEYFGIILSSPTSLSSLVKHGQTSASIWRTLHFRVMNPTTTVSLANLASGS